MVQPNIANNREAPEIFHIQKPARPLNVQLSLSWQPFSVG